MRYAKGVGCKRILRDSLKVFLILKWPDVAFNGCCRQWMLSSVNVSINEYCCQ
jgi:hypothetical protein